MKSMNLFGDNNKTLLPAPIQDGDGNLTFSLEEKAYSLNVNSEEPSTIGLKKRQEKTIGFFTILKCMGY